MRVTEVIPSGKLDDEMEAGRWRWRGVGGVEKEAHRQRERKKESPGGMFIPSYRLFVICILDLSKKNEKSPAATRRHPSICFAPAQVND